MVNTCFCLRVCFGYTLEEVKRNTRYVLDEVAQKPGPLYQRIGAVAMESLRLRWLKGTHFCNSNTISTQNSCYTSTPYKHGDLWFVPACLLLLSRDYTFLTRHISRFQQILGVSLVASGCSSKLSVERTTLDGVAGHMCTKKCPRDLILGCSGFTAVEMRQSGEFISKCSG